MKNLILSFLVLSSFSLTGCDKESILNTNEIPSEISSFVTLHFPDNSILQCIKDYDDLTHTFVVTLNNVTTLEFNRKKEIIGVKSSTKLPDSVIPEKILNHVAANFSGQVIVEWDKDKKDQQVKLDNTLELVFNNDGDFIRVDD